MYICIYVPMHICIYVYMYICKYVNMYICMCVYICLYVCVRVGIRICVCTHIRTPPPQPRQCLLCSPSSASKLPFTPPPRACSSSILTRYFSTFVIMCPRMSSIRSDEEVGAKSRGRMSSPHGRCGDCPVVCGPALFPVIVSLVLGRQPLRCRWSPTVVTVLFSCDASI